MSKNKSTAKKQKPRMVSKYRPDITLNLDDIIENIANKQPPDEECEDFCDEDGGCYVCEDVYGDFARKIRLVGEEQGFKIETTPGDVIPYTAIDDMIAALQEMKTRV